MLCSGDTYSNGSTGGSASFNNSHSYDISRNKAYATIGNYSERIVFQSSSSFKWANETGDMYTWTHNADEKLNSSHSHYADGQFIRVSGVTEDVTTSIPTLPPYLAVTVWKRVA